MFLLLLLIYHISIFIYNLCTNCLYLWTDLPSSPCRFRFRFLPLPLLPVFLSRLPPYISSLLNSPFHTIPPSLPHPHPLLLVFKPRPMVSMLVFLFFTILFSQLYRLTLYHLFVLFINNSNLCYPNRPLSLLISAK